MKRIFPILLIAMLAISIGNTQTHELPSLENLGNFDELVPTTFTSYNLFEVDPSVFPAQNGLFDEVTSVASGNWDTPETWDCNCVPNGANSVTIEENHVIEFSEDKEVYTLHIRPNGSLSAGVVALTLTVRRDLAVYGDLDLSSAILSLEGAELQRLYGNCNLDGLECNSTNEIIVEGNLFITRQLWVNQATFNTSNRLYMVSSGSYVAQIGPIFEGEIIGEIITSKEITIAQSGFISLGTPVSNSTIQTIVDDFVTTGFEGSDYPNNSFQNVRYYVEESDDVSTDYNSPGNSTDPMFTGRGYYVYALAGSYVFNEQGTPNVGVVDIDVDFTNNASPATDGLNLVANPYQAVVNWDTDEGWNKENLVGALYVWDTSQKQFRTYINGSGVNGGTAYIQPMEAFWVMASEANPTLSINEAAKVLHNANTEESSQNMTVSITNGVFSDELVLTSNSQASALFDPAYDALKFYGDNSVPNISTLSEDDVKLAINNLPNAQEEYSVDMMINIPTAGQYTLNISGVETFLSNRCIVIEDLLTEEIYDITEVDQIVFTTEQVENEIRFKFHLGTPVTADSVPVQCTGEATGSVVAQGSGDGPWNYTWYDSDMNLIGETLDEASAFEITGLQAGSYNVAIENNDFCSTLTVGVVVVEAPELLEVDHSIWHIDCDEDNTGEILLNLNGGLQPIMVEWDNEMFGANIEDLDQGEYTYTVTDGNGCVRTDMLTIIEAVEVIAEFETDFQTVALDENNEATVMFTNTSVGATNFSWDFGDGFNTSTEESLEHTFTQPGFYTVSMFADNDDCDDYYQTVIAVDLYSGISETDLVDQVNIIANEDQVVVSSSSTFKAQVTVEVYDLLGKVIDSKKGLLGGNHQMTLSLDQANALYMVSVLNQATGERTIRKISRF